MLASKVLKVLADDKTKLLIAAGAPLAVLYCLSSRKCKQDREDKGAEQQDKGLQKGKGAKRKDKGLKEAEEAKQQDKGLQKEEGAELLENKPPTPTPVINASSESLGEVHAVVCSESALTSALVYLPCFIAAKTLLKIGIWVSVRASSRLVVMRSKWLKLFIPSCCLMVVLYMSNNSNRKENKRSPTPEKKRNKRNYDRELQECEEKREAVMAVKRYIQNEPLKLPDMGCRLQKYWFRAPAIITTTTLSKKCPVNLTDRSNVRKLNRLISSLKHEYLQPILKIDYCEESNKVIVITFQQEASLKDLIFCQDDPTLDWSQKYAPKSTPILPLSPTLVASCGWKILEAVTYLYEQDFPLIGHIHTGNIYVNYSDWKALHDAPPTNVQGLSCQLGGYENSLLGYKTRLYRKIEDEGCLQSIDVIMFGHMIYEMCTGRELKGVFPSKSELESVRNGECKEALRFIFERNNDESVIHTIEQIKLHDFFASEAEFSRLGSRGSLVPSNLKEFLRDNCGPHARSKGGIKVVTSQMTTWVLGGAKKIGQASSFLNRFRSPPA